MNKKVIIGGIVFLVIAAVAVFVFVVTAPPKEVPDEDIENIGPTTEEKVKDYSADIVYKKDSFSGTPQWILGGTGVGPWEQSLYMATSTDGKTFTNEKFFVQHAGVVNLLWTKDNKLVAIFQYFSYEEPQLFDRIVYTVSEDYGATWSVVKRVKFNPMYEPDQVGGQTPVDPTLVQLDDGRYRLYFTYQKYEDTNPSLYSGVSSTLDGVFQDEGKQLSTNAMLLDPAVVFFKDQWHHYTRNYEGLGDIHSVSDTGLSFSRQDDISAGFQFLGNAIEDNGKIRFYGSGPGVVLAESTDGYTFTKIKENIVNGADPGIAKLPDGSYVMVYTKM